MTYILYYTKNTKKQMYNIIEYLNSLKYNINPIYEYEILQQNTQNLQLPIIIHEHVYHGYTECVRFFTEQSCIIHLQDKANEFIKNRQVY